MWICDDNEINSETEKKHEVEEVQPGGASISVKPPGYYVNREAGLFPAPISQSGTLCSKVADLFWFLGAFLAKTLQDNRLVDLPLSRSFLKILCQGEISSMVRKRAHQPETINTNTETCSAAQVGGPTFDDYDIMTSSTMSILSEAESDLDTSGGSGKGIYQTRSSPSPGLHDLKNDQKTEAWYAHILTVEDLVEVDPPRGKFLASLQELVTKKQAILASHELSTEEMRTAALSELMIDIPGGQLNATNLEDLQLTFQYSPSSSIFTTEDNPIVDLVPNGGEKVVTLENVDEYVTSSLDFILDQGIRKQMNAFRKGFNAVFPIERLGSFAPAEVRTMLCGDQCPVFTREDIIRYTEPKLGYSRDSAAFLKFVNVLVNFTASERKSFLQFTTGCSSLPPGGLANLSPRLTIVRKIDAGDGSYPSVNTCVHYLKLPDYSSEDVMREKLLMATKEKGFHLN